MIITVDFDGILCETGNFPEIGKPVYPMISFVRELIDQGHEVILWTSRVDKPLEEAVKWCADRGLHFCAVNDNAPSNKEAYLSQYPNGTRKVYADLYVDDHNVHSQWMLADGYDHHTVIRDFINRIRRIIQWKKKSAEAR